MARGTDADSRGRRQSLVLAHILGVLSLTSDDIHHFVLLLSIIPPWNRANLVLKVVQ